MAGLLQWATPRRSRPRPVLKMASETVYVINLPFLQYSPPLIRQHFLRALPQCKRLSINVTAAARIRTWSIYIYIYTAEHKTNALPICDDPGYKIAYPICFCILLLSLLKKCLPCRRFFRSPEDQSEDSSPTIPTHRNKERQGTQ